MLICGFLIISNFFALIISLFCTVGVEHAYDTVGGAQAVGGELTRRRFSKIIITD